MSTEFEPVRGLPEALPPGERVLWQGSPDWRSLAVRALHVRKVAIYFALLGAWTAAASVLSDGAALPTALLSAASVLPLAGGAIGLLGLYAWLIGRTTIYTVTDRRVVMRIGVALPLTVNVPHRIVAAAGLKLDGNGAGDIPLALTGRDKLAYLALWPHARPWRVTKPEPMLRSVPDAARVAGLLADALHATAGQPASIGRDAAPVEAERPARGGQSLPVAA